MTKRGAEPPAPAYYHVDGQRFRLSSIVVTDALFIPTTVTDQDKALCFALLLTRAADEAQKRLMRIVEEHRSPVLRARARLRARGYHWRIGE